ncbi:2571_t:CDS:1, partial [Diversispora eburnea]
LIVYRYPYHNEERRGSTQRIIDINKTGIANVISTIRDVSVVLSIGLDSLR